MTKPIAQVMQEYQDTIRLMLSNQPNFMGDENGNPIPVECHEVPNTPDMRKVLRLIPNLHKQYSYEVEGDAAVPADSDPPMEGWPTGHVVAKIYVTPAAKEVLDTVGQDLLDRIKEAEATSPAFEHPLDDKRFTDAFGDAELMMAEALLGEIEDEESEATKGSDSSEGSL